MTDTWTKKTDLGFKGAPPTVILDGKIYAIGGRPHAHVVVAEFDPEAGQSQSVQPTEKLSTAWGRLKTQ